MMKLAGFSTSSKVKNHCVKGNRGLVALNLNVEHLKFAMDGSYIAKRKYIKRGVPHCSLSHAGLS